MEILKGKGGKRYGRIKNKKGKTKLGYNLQIRGGEEKG